MIRPSQTSCEILGVLNQFSFGAHWYAGALSFYFLMTVRCGMREKEFGRKYERFIHFSIILWSVGTAVTGMVIHVYYQRRISPGCWVR